MLAGSADISPPSSVLSVAVWFWSLSGCVFGLKLMILRNLNGTSIAAFNLWESCERIDEDESREGTASFDVVSMWRHRSLQGFLGR